MQSRKAAKSQRVGASLARKLHDEIAERLGFMVCRKSV